MNQFIVTEARCVFTRGEFPQDLEKQIPAAELLRDVNPNANGKMKAEALVLINLPCQCCLALSRYTNYGDDIEAIGFLQEIASYGSFLIFKTYYSVFPDWFILLER